MLAGEKFKYRFGEKSNDSCHRKYREDVFFYCLKGKIVEGLFGFFFFFWKGRLPHTAYHLNECGLLEAWLPCLLLQVDLESLLGGSECTYSCTLNWRQVHRAHSFRKDLWGEVREEGDKGEPVGSAESTLVINVMTGITARWPSHPAGLFRRKKKNYIIWAKFYHT